MRHPLGPAGAPISSPYGPRWGTQHLGIDYAVPVGTPIYAPADGVVIEGRERPQGSVDGFGSWIWLDCQQSIRHDLIFGHVQGDRTVVTAGDRVRAGDLIGYTGNEGTSTGPHLHFEAWTAPGRIGGRAVDPAPLVSSTPTTSEPKEQKLATIIDTAGGFPSPAAIKRAGHAGHVVYVSPDRTGGGLPGKPVTRAHVDALRAAGLDVACVWQYGKDSAAAPPDVLRGAAGGAADARAADAKLRELGLDGWPVFFAVDFDITLPQWNATAVHYFRAAAQVLGRDRVGIYGHSRVCHWAGPDDKVVAEVAPGRYLAWQTPAWSGGVIARDYAVLYQRVLDTPSRPGPRIDGMAVDVNDALHPYWGQRPMGSTTVAPTPPTGGPAMKPNPNHRGDPVFLPDLLRLWGVQVVEYPGWKNRGQGDFTDIWGVMVHHTGAANTSPKIIAEGHSALRGLLSQIHLDPKGVATICGAGLAYHAGEGRLPGLGGGYVTRPTVSPNKSFPVGNGRMIGIEAQHSGNPKDPWPEAQMEAYARICAALCWYLGWGTDRVWGHKEYATPQGRKVDPTFDMEGFRRRVQALLDRPPFLAAPTDPGPGTPPAAPNDKEKNMLDQTITSRVNPAVQLRVKDVLELADEYLWKGARADRAIIANQAALHANQAALLDALGVPVTPLPVQDYDQFIAAEVEADRAPKGGA